MTGRQSRGPHPYATQQPAGDRPDRAPSPVPVTGRVLWDARMPAGGLPSGCPAGGPACGTDRVSRCRSGQSAFWWHLEPRSHPSRAASTEPSGRSPQRRFDLRPGIQRSFGCVWTSTPRRARSGSLSHSHTQSRRMMNRSGVYSPPLAPLTALRGAGRQRERFTRSTPCRSGTSTPRSGPPHGLRQPRRRRIRRLRDWSRAHPSSTVPRSAQ